MLWETTQGYMEELRVNNLHRLVESPALYIMSWDTGPRADRASLLGPGMVT